MSGKRSVGVARVRICVLVGAAALLAGGAWATVFPDADESHDFTSSAAWGGLAFPLAAEFSSDATLVAGADGSFTTFTVKGGADVTFDLLLTPIRLISMSEKISVSETGTKAQFLGGKWTTAKTIDVGSSASTDVSAIFSNAQVTCSKPQLNGKNNQFLLTGADATLTANLTGTYPIFDGGRSNLVWLTDGATWTHNNNNLYMAISGKPTNCVFRVDNGASFSSTKPFYIGYNVDEYGNRVEVGDNATFTAGSLTLQRKGQELVISNGTVKTKNWMGYAATSENCRFALQGPKAQYIFTQTGALPLWGTQTSRGCLTEVIDGAVWNFSSNGVYSAINGATSNCTFRLARKGRFEMNAGYAFYLGYNVNEFGNRMEILDGGEFKSANSIYVARTGQGLLISNGTVRCTFFGFQSTSAKDSTITLLGANNVIEESAMRNEMFPTQTYGNTFEIADEAVYAHKSTTQAYYTSVADTPSNNLLRVTRKGTLACHNGFLFGYNKDHDNFMEVLDGGCVTSSYISVGGINNHLTVSNGVLQALQSTASTINIGYAWGSANTNATLTIAGTNSQIRTSGSFGLWNGATIDFRIPAEGYAVTPIEADVDLNIKAGTHLTFEAGALQTRLAKGTNVVLVTCKEGYSIDQGVIDEANATLAAKRMTLAFDKAKMALALYIRPPKQGAILLFR